MKDTGVSLQLAYQSTKKQKEILENVLVRVDRFIFPVDFIVREMEKNTRVPLILGRSFLVIGRAIINVHQGQLILRVDEKRVIFDMQKIIKYPEDESSSSSCFQIDLLHDLTDEYKYDHLITDSLERCLENPGTISDDDTTIRKEAEMLGKNSENEETKCLKELQAMVFTIFLTDILGIIIYQLLRKIKRKLHSHAPKHCMSAIFSNMIEQFLEIFMDDFTLFGHNIYAKGIEVDKAKIDLIAGLTPPITVKGIRSFLGNSSFYRRKAFEILKEHLTNVPIVVSPDWSEPFEIMCDASDIAVGAILGQKRDKIFRPIYYASRTLNEAQKNYATTEKELLAVVFVFVKFHSYLIGTNVTVFTGTKVTVFTDHTILKYLLAKKDARPSLLRWILLLQDFDLEIKDRRGLENQVANHLSCLENPPTETTNIKEEFSDEHIYTITTIENHPPWFADIANYLVGGRCVPEIEMNNILSHCHDGAVGKYYRGRRTAAKCLKLVFSGPLYLEIQEVMLPLATNAR
ncbi:uncharacterized protein LOC142167806 [Nicotiana tabacum]|uniref:Uncharacterized protein LOC142167806 n=1 Tax=Nicotiana tabacum TaxID=4097 RepID=A0AC58SFX7_TOBAC